MSTASRGVDIEKVRGSARENGWEESTTDVAKSVMSTFVKDDMVLHLWPATGMVSTVMGHPTRGKTQMCRGNMLSNDICELLGDPSKQVNQQPEMPVLGANVKKRVATINARIKALEEEASPIDLRSTVGTHSKHSTFQLEGGGVMFAPLFAAKEVGEVKSVENIQVGHSLEISISETKGEECWENGGNEGPGELGAEEGEGTTGSGASERVDEGHRIEELDETKHDEGFGKERWMEIEYEACEALGGVQTDAEFWGNCCDDFNTSSDSGESFGLSEADGLPLRSSQSERSFDEAEGGEAGWIDPTTPDAALVSAVGSARLAVDHKKGKRTRRRRRRRKAGKKGEQADQDAAASEDGDVYDLWALVSPYPRTFIDINSLAFEGTLLSNWLRSSLASHVCGYCGINYSNNIQLEQHLRTETSHGVFFCCGKLFKSRKSLKRHLAFPRHYGEGPYRG